ncbi:chitobiase/beta-hexosaminidase C-terminal domain-containing protein [Lentzea sp. BCCO 10_0856]|uniref:Chitobiase/beta-hexosaminidase C-terminal domain-containing protein n=1 Tax=Lentzea miocenica TaxID=3095431 RepID=A0ABU4T4X2_9PSEU|nr:chitobiase/beta-hexosaminidase C-terminal domain-containing protein [Lentzea sp. BCCO 10_0856]MDX8033225.1 chitobiase/beta-hexosaminidase C-terminal domain-containing protein [Lentzea sp. BCCO 10_0856]
MRALSKTRWRAGLAAVAIALSSLATVEAAYAADDYTQNVTAIDATQARINFTPTTPALYVDVHYLISGQTQQNFRMTNNAGTWQKTVGSLSSGTVIDYWFTYEKSGPQYDSPHFSYTHNSAPQPVATPTFSPPGGTYATAQTVTISTATSGATIRYTTDGSTPTGSSLLYSGPISVPSNRTINAIGIKSGQANSSVGSASYVIGTPVATPTFSPPGGAYTSAQTVTISTATSGATIRYTVDGSTPTASSPLYSGPISVPTSRTVSAIGIKSGLANSAVASATYTIGTQQGCVQPDNPSFGPNTRVFDPGMSAASIQAQLDTDFNNQKDTLTAQMAPRRVAHLFKPGTYNVHDDVGYYTSVSGLGKNPGDVVINGDITVDAFNESDKGVALQNFWRSAENMAVNPSNGTNRWAVAQAAPFRRMDIRGNLALYPASYGFASGGYTADSRVSGQTASISQQQWYTRDSNYGSWNGGVWNMVFSGTPGAPPNTFPSPPETTLATTPVSRDVPYLYFENGAYRVFLPSLRTNASGASWINGGTPGTSLAMNQFYVVKAGDTAATINAALGQGCNLFFTPGIYNVNQTINITRPNTVVLGIGYATIVPQNGVTAMQVADVDGVRIKGILFDAGTTLSSSLLTVGPAGSSASHAANPTTLQDVFFRVGGAVAGKATNSLVVNSNHTIIDHSWIWRADHGNAGTWGWNEAIGDTGLVVNGNDVLATGLFVEHYQKYQVIWNGERGRTIFFQNEMPYDVPNQASWNRPNGQAGYAAYKVGDNVTTHEAWGLGSYCFFNVNPSVRAENAFEVPNRSGVRLHNLLTVSLNYQGTITHVVNNVGGVTPPGTVPVNVVNYP